MKQEMSLNEYKIALSSEGCNSLYIREGNYGLPGGRTATADMKALRKYQ